MTVSKMGGKVSCVLLRTEHSACIVWEMLLVVKLLNRVGPALGRAGICFCSLLFLIISNSTTLESASNVRSGDKLNGLKGAKSPD